jgi:ribonuclease R
MSNELIELLMIMANNAVSETLNKNSTNYISRIHPSPQGFAINELNEILDSLKLEKVTEKNVRSQDLNKILLKIKGLTNSSQQKQKILSVLPKAIYLQRGGKHFGLNLNSYCHFTSPIRRYSDLTVHRSLASSLGWVKNGYSTLEDLEQISLQINITEKNSVSAERESIDRFSAFFMTNQGNRVFNAEISGVSQFFVFVKLNDFPIEGVILKKELLKKRSLKILLGKKNMSHKRSFYSLEGHNLKVKLSSAYPHNGTITFSI